MRLTMSGWLLNFKMDSEPRVLSTEKKGAFLFPTKTTIRCRSANGRASDFHSEGCEFKPRRQLHVNKHYNKILYSVIWKEVPNV